MSSFQRVAAGAAVALWVSCLCRGGPAQESETTNPYRIRLAAPPLDGGLEWVNTAKPIGLADLRGRFVLLDFWTFCCINCMQELPEIKKLEQAFPNELVVIGVHSAKFEGEQDSQNIREAVLRYEIDHPVVNDANMAIWQRYGARSWPTLVLIDPAGEVVWAASGERSFEEIKAVIDRGLPYYREHELLVPAPRPALASGKTSQETALRFPSKVLADAEGDRLFISDSNHNRIVVTNLAGKALFVVGSGAIGRADGELEQASFHRPQGMALVGNLLYVADTANNLLRKIDLGARQVTTVAGTGVKGNGWPGWRDDGGVHARAASNKFVGPPRSTALASPWACLAHENDLYVAMAGSHQIWKMPFDEREIGPYAGNGREDIVDGPLLPPKPFDVGYSSFAQPSGLASDGTQLFVADSEGSTVRSVSFDPSGEAKTLVGLTGTLFDFGDVDGVGRDVRLQHPLDVAWADGSLYVADTYNNKIKVIQPEARSCHAIAGTGSAGLVDGAGVAANFNEPGGISAARGKLYVADTNNHVIRVVDLPAPYRVTTLAITGLEAPRKPFASDAAK